MDIIQVDWQQLEGVSEDDGNRQGISDDVFRYIGDFKQLEDLDLEADAFDSLFDLEKCLGRCPSSLITLGIDGEKEDPLGPASIEVIDGVIQELRGHVGGTSATTSAPISASHYFIANNHQKIASVKKVHINEYTAQTFMRKLCISKRNLSIWTSYVLQISVVYFGHLFWIGQIGNWMLSWLICILCALSSKEMDCFSCGGGSIICRY